MPPTATKLDLPKPARGYRWDHDAAGTPVLCSATAIAYPTIHGKLIRRVPPEGSNDTQIWMWINYVGGHATSPGAGVAERAHDAVIAGMAASGRLHMVATDFQTQRVPVPAAGPPPATGREPGLHPAAPERGRR